MFIDATDEEGQQQLIQVTGSLKKIEKLNSDYKCVLQDCEMCTYFTSKETHQNYLEIHSTDLLVLYICAVEKLLFFFFLILLWRLM